MPGVRFCLNHWRIQNRNADDSTSCFQISWISWISCFTAHVNIHETSVSTDEPLPLTGPRFVSEQLLFAFFQSWWLIGIIFSCQQMMVEMLCLFLDQWSHAFRLPGKYDSLIIFLMVPGQGARKVTQGHEVTEGIRRGKKQRQEKWLSPYYECVHECVRFVAKTASSFIKKKKK